MTLRGRLAIGIIAIALILITPLLLVRTSLTQLTRSVASLSDRDVAASLLLARMHGATDELHKAELALVYAGDSAATDSTRGARVAAAIAELDAMSDSLTTFGLRDATRDVRAAVRRVEDLVPNEIDALRHGRGAFADTISSFSVGPALARIDSVLVKTERDVSVRTQRSAESAMLEAEDARSVANIALVGALVLAALIAIWLTSTISRPVRELEEGMAAVAEGDFTHPLEEAPRRRDEFGRLAKSYRAMADQLRHLDALQAEFVSVASHELKTPINVIIGYLQLLQENVYGDLSPQQREICATLSSQANALARLVKQLLDVTRFEAGGGKLEVRPMRLPHFLDEMEEAFRVLALQRGVGFFIERGDGIPDEVVWDRDRMSEVIGNLLSNAFKFTERGGRVSLSIDAFDHALRMEVRDTGAGITPEQLPFIFEKFFQADNQGAASAKGTGLGLAIAKTIVEAHGGTIAVESTPGVGTAFTLTMPVRTVAGRAHPPLPALADVTSL